MRYLTLLAAFILIQGCTKSGFQLSSPSSSSTAKTSATTSTPSSTPTTTQGLNVVPLTLGAGSVNQISVSVTICVPGTTNCQTVSNLLLDTGSTGVRVFSSAISSVYTSLPKTGLANCTSYADNSYDWGPMVTADVALGQEKASSVPVQVIDNGYADSGKACVAEIKANDSSEGVTASPTADALSSGYNGIVGVNFQSQDCGSYCVTNADSGMYFSCSGTTCATSTAPLAAQMTNPVSLMPYDNNGVVLQFASISGTGTSSGSGTMYLGIGTQTNNTPSPSVKTLTADSNESDSNYTCFTTSFQGSTITGFIDSGSGCLAFPFSNTSQLPEDSSGMFTPATPVSLSATQIGYNSVQSSVGFTIANWNNYVVQPECGESLGNSFASSDFDWGFPFFVGRTVYVGLEGKTSSLGTGFYWAY